MRVDPFSDLAEVLRDGEVLNRGCPRCRHRLGRAQSKNVSRKSRLIKIEAL